jgi:hypothetical protein
MREIQPLPESSDTIPSTLRSFAGEDAVSDTPPEPPPPRLYLAPASARPTPRVAIVAMASVVVFVGPPTDRPRRKRRDVSRGVVPVGVVVAALFVTAAENGGAQ